MVAVTHKAVSGYRLKMEQTLRDLEGQGKTTVTQDDLASMLGGQVTPAFRRHIAEMQADGYVTRYTYQSENGGWKVAYSFAFGGQHA